MSADIPAVGGIPQPEFSVVDPATERNSAEPTAVAPSPPPPVVIHLPGISPMTEQNVLNGQDESGTALQVARIAFVAILLIVAAVLLVLGLEVGAIITLFVGVGYLAIELLKRL